MVLRIPAPVERVVFGLTWLLLAIVISLGGAGIAAALDHQPGTAARPELTWPADSALAPELDAATTELRAIAGLVDDLGLRGRGALAALAARDFEVLERLTTEGATLATEIDDRNRALRSRVARLQGFGPGADLTLSREVQDRHAALLDGTGQVAELAGTWGRLTVGGLSAGRLSGLLATHDERITAAIEAGRGGDFDAALERIAEAAAALDEAEVLREELAPTTDVATLDEWLRRNRNYDVALRRLYEATRDALATPNRITPELRDALRGELAARNALPETTAGLEIVMADIGQGGLNQVVIAIEETRGELAEVLTVLER